MGVGFIRDSSENNRTRWKKKKKRGRERERPGRRLEELLARLAAKKERERELTRRSAAVVCFSMTARAF